MKRVPAATVAVAFSLMMASAGGQIIAAPCVPSPASPLVRTGARNVLESIPNASLFLGLRMQNGKMYAINGSGGADADITPHIVIGPLRPTPPVMRILPVLPGVQIIPQPVLPRVPQPAPQR